VWGEIGPFLLLRLSAPGGSNPGARSRTGGAEESEYLGFLDDDPEGLEEAPGFVDDVADQLVFQKPRGRSMGVSCSGAMHVR
jgi:hypothetical protein